MSTYRIIVISSVIFFVVGIWVFFAYSWLHLLAFWGAVTLLYLCMVFWAPRAEETDGFYRMRVFRTKAPFYRWMGLEVEEGWISAIVYVPVADARGAARRKSSSSSS